MIKQVKHLRKYPKRKDGTRKVGTYEAGSKKFPKVESISFTQQSKLDEDSYMTVYGKGGWIMHRSNYPDAFSGEKETSFYYGKLNISISKHHPIFGSQKNYYVFTYNEKLKQYGMIKMSVKTRAEGEIVALNWIKQFMEKYAKKRGSIKGWKKDEDWGPNVTYKSERKGVELWMQEDMSGRWTIGTEPDGIFDKAWTKEDAKEIARDFMERHPDW